MGFLYFRTCCEFPNEMDNYFGIEYIPNEPLIFGITYKVITETQSLCAVYYDGEVPNGVTVYNDVIDVLYYGLDCYECLLENPCETPIPTPIPNQSQPINECDVVTIFPMGIKCVILNPTSPTSSDGEMSVSITGGTPPYTIIWSNGNTSPAIQNLTIGKYTATVIDYYGDYTATTTCELTSEYDCSFSGVVENFIPDQTPTPTPTNTTTPTPTPTQAEFNCNCVRYEFINPTYGTNPIVTTVTFRLCASPNPFVSDIFGSYFSVCACEDSYSVPEYIQVIKIGPSNCIQ